MAPHAPVIAEMRLADARQGSRHRDDYPSNNAIGTVVAAADIRNVDTVIIGGAIRKFRGKLVGVNMTKFRQQVDESRHYLFQRAGYQLDIFSS